MATSRSEDGNAPVLFSLADPADIDALKTLADLAGIKAPGNTMKIIIELITMGVPPMEVHSLVRDVLASKSRSRRAGVKHSSRQLQATPETIQENTAP